MGNDAVLGVIGGSGLYDIDGLENTRMARSWSSCRATAAATGFRPRS